MSTEENQEATVEPTETTEQVEEPKEEEVVDNNISLSREEYDKLNETIGSLKRENKDLKKPKAPKEAPKQEKKSDEEMSLLQRLALKSEGITDQDEGDLAKKLKEETGKEWDSLLESKYFKAELEELRTNKANTAATSGVKGGGGESKAKQDPAFWIAKGTPPTRDDVPDRKTRAKIARAMMDAQKSSKMFYNE